MSAAPAGPETAGAPAPDASAAVLILVLGVCGFASTFSMRLVDPLVPMMATDFERTVKEVAVLAAAFSFAYAAGQPVLGPLGDALGKARTIQACCFLAGLGSLACAIATSFEFLLVARFMSGVVAGGIIPLAMAAIGDRVALADRQRALSQLMLVTIFGQMGGAAASGLIADLTHWRTVFVVAAAIAFAATAFVTIRIRPAAQAARRPLSLSGAIAGYRGVLSNPRAIPLYALVFVEGSLVQGLNPFVADILRARSGVGATEAGFVIGGSGVGALLFALSAPFVVRALRPGQMTRAGGLIMAGGMALFSIAVVPWWSAPAFFVLIGFGFFLLHNNLQTQATELSQTHRGSAVALFASSFFLGQAAGPLLFAGLFWTIGTTPALLLAALCLASLGFLVPRLLRL